MFLVEGFTTFKYLWEEDPSFDASGMLGVTFSNKGQTIAVVNDEEVYPGENFVTPINVVQTGKFSIRFRPGENPQPGDKNRLMVKYTEVTGTFNFSQLEHC